MMMLGRLWIWACEWLLRAGRSLEAWADGETGGFR
jgi:hypothetical protein